MRFEVSREWLAKKLALCDDGNVAAGGTSFEQFKKDIEERTVTPSVLSNVPTELGKVVRYVRERKGWTRAELAELADIDEAELELLETQSNYDPRPRTVVQLADVCHFKRDSFIELAKHRLKAANGDNFVRFAAKSKSTESVSDIEYEAVRALVEYLSK